MTSQTITRYQLEGRMLEVCTCEIICPCWVGENPDGGACDGSMAWHIDQGQIQGVDVSGLTVALAVHLPGNVFEGKWRVVVYVDEFATLQQEQALLQAFSGQLGGPIADFAQLFGEILKVERAPITFTVEGGKGKLIIGQAVEAELVPFLGATGQTTTLIDSAFSSIPGAPAYVGKASLFRSTVPELGHNVNLKGYNAVQGFFRFEH
ncbi:MAG TPA: DUF1326 domain-containing protein [Chloroflexia bacterium]|nr:DUF1326 domain-containing protein [Chloroflexia bacterium]